MPKRNGDCSGLFAPRPKYQASHGTTEVMYGTPAASAASDTGFTTSGVEVASIRSTLLPLIRSPATFAACAGADWLSFVTICTAYLVPPTVRPLAKALRASETTYGSGSPTPAAGPVSGLTNPIVIVSAYAAASFRGRAHAGEAATPPSTTPPAPTPARLTSSRLVSDESSAMDPPRNRANGARTLRGALSTCQAGVLIFGTCTRSRSS